MKKFLTVACILTLSVALLAGCSGNSGASSSTASSSSAASSSAPTQPDSQAASDQTDGEQTDALPSAEPGSIEEAANQLIGFEGDSAGGSLKTALAATALLDWCSDNADYDEAELTERLTAWYDGLTDSQKQLFAANVTTVITQADNIVADPESQSGLLSDAGVETDYTGYDANFSGLRNALVAMIQSEQVDVADSSVSSASTSGAQSSSASASTAG